MDWKTFYRRRKEINCDICCSDLVGDIIGADDNEVDDDKIQQILELVDYVEQKKFTETKINVLKFYRKINYESL